LRAVADERAAGGVRRLVAPRGIEQVAAEVEIGRARRLVLTGAPVRAPRSLDLQQRTERGPPERDELQLRQSSEAHPTEEVKASICRLGARA